MNKMEVNDELTNAIVGDLGHSNLFAGLEEILIAEMPNACLRREGGQESGREGDRKKRIDIARGLT